MAFSNGVSSSAIMDGQDDCSEVVNELEQFQRSLSLPQGNGHGRPPNKVLSSNQLHSLALNADHRSEGKLLMDANETLKFESADDLANHLGIGPESECKVLTILGNTGEGKSHTLNDTLFDGKEIFPTSESQDSCTIGVWVAHQPTLQLLVLDTEGMLGVCDNENKRQRLLMKVLALSDIIIYKTRAERLQNDLFHFLGDASKSYNNHFLDELMEVATASGDSRDGYTNDMGPTLIISHDVQFTDVLKESESESALRSRFTKLKQDCSAYKKIIYSGCRRANHAAEAGGTGTTAENTKLREIIEKEARDESIRIKRRLDLIFKALQHLNDKFSGDISRQAHRSFPDEYFTCQAKCTACDQKCQLRLNHADGHKAGQDAKGCVYQEKHKNKISYCQKCRLAGRLNPVVPKASSADSTTLGAIASNLWSGYVLECNDCGVIFKSRENWLDNQEPEKCGVISSDICHMWPGLRAPQGTHNGPRLLVDGVNSISESLSHLTTDSLKSLGEYVSDTVAPNYWQPNSECSKCNYCKNGFSSQEAKHHCRRCGKIFCDNCSSYKLPVPEHGWGSEPQKCCKTCHDAYLQGGSMSVSAASDPGDIKTRRIAESFLGTIGAIGSYLAPAVNTLKDTTNPSYWLPDSECKVCPVCEKDFGPTLKIHHCRDCGYGVCDPCSKTRRPVPMRGWDTPQRVCNTCIKKSIYKNDKGQ